MDKNAKLEFEASIVLLASWQVGPLKANQLGLSFSEMPVIRQLEERFGERLVNAWRLRYESGVPTN